MRVVVITPPPGVVTLAEAKQHLRVDHDEDDALIGIYLAAAHRQVDGPDAWLGRAIGVQTLEAYPSSFEVCDPLPRPEIIDVVSVKYLDPDRVLQTVDPATYELHDRHLVLAEDATWPTVYAGVSASKLPVVQVRYRAGYVADPLADPLVAAVPDDIRAAILLITGDLYANRETAVTGTVAAKIPMSATVENLLATYRVYA